MVSEVEQYEEQDTPEETRVYNTRQRHTDCKGQGGGNNKNKVAVMVV